MALAEAKRAGAYESIMGNAEGYLVEGSSSNIFVVTAGQLRTPPLADGLLEGITRGRVIEIAAGAGLRVVEEHLLPDDLRRADEAFITSSVRGVMPVVGVDGATVADGRPGRVTRNLMARYAEFLVRVATGDKH